MTKHVEDIVDQKPKESGQCHPLDSKSLEASQDAGSSKKKDIVIIAENYNPQLSINYTSLVDEIISSKSNRRIHNYLLKLLDNIFQS